MASTSRAWDVDQGGLLPVGSSSLKPSVDWRPVARKREDTFAFADKLSEKHRRMAAVEASLSADAEGMQQAV